VWNGWWYQNGNSTSWNDMGFEQRLLFIGGIVVLLLLTYIADRLLNRDEYKIRKGKW